MTKLYIIVQTNKSQHSEQSMVTRNSSREVISYAGIIASRSGLEDDIIIDHIFSVNEYGKVEHHEIEFVKGKLVLTAIPTVV